MKLINHYLVSAVMLSSLFAPSAQAGEFNALIPNPFIFCSAPKPCKLCEPFRKIYDEICESQKGKKRNPSDRAAQEQEAENRVLSPDQEQAARNRVLSPRQELEAQAEIVAVGQDQEARGRVLSPAQELEARNRALTPTRASAARQDGADALVAALESGSPIVPLDENTADLTFNAFAAGWNSEWMKRRQESQ